MCQVAILTNLQVTSCFKAVQNHLLVSTTKPKDMGYFSDISSSRQSKCTCVFLVVLCQDC